eukprot:629291_1
MPDFRLKVAHGGGGAQHANFACVSLIRLAHFFEFLSHLLIVQEEKLFRRTSTALLLSNLTVGCGGPFISSSSNFGRPSLTVESIDSRWLRPEDTTVAVTGGPIDSRPLTRPACNGRPTDSRPSPIDS